MTHRVEPLRRHHDLEAFDCGNDALSEWLKRHAHHATRQGTRTYVLVDERTSAVAGYFAIAPHLVERGRMPKRIGRGAPGRIPAILLAKLALARDAQGRGLGRDLLVRALETCVEAARVAGGKLVVVDAVDEAARRFYEHHDFEAIPQDPSRLVMKLSTVSSALRLPWP
ncbi:MAG: GNAT family N-acetyltransferase [Acidobacteria bacterium]|nr:GNAT family N-acetyltransferase [Acidobacteriota bacterium]